MKYLTILITAIALTACQTTPKINFRPDPTAQVLQFAITGKIGINTKTPNGNQSVSAFYSWGQDDNRFAINLTGALGLGATSITYDGNQAILTSGNNTLTADSPESLLLQTTGLYAPLAHFPYWIMGKNAPNDYDSQFENNQLIATKNGEWTVALEYQDTRPNRLKITHNDGHRVVMTINHE